MQKLSASDGIMLRCGWPAPVPPIDGPARFARSVGDDGIRRPRGFGIAGIVAVETGDTVGLCLRLPRSRKLVAFGTDIGRLAGQGVEAGGEDGYQAALNLRQIVKRTGPHMN